MSDRKVSQLPALSATSSDDLLLVVDNPNGTPASKKISIKVFFGKVPANTQFVASNTLFTANTTCTNRFTANTFIVAADKIRITTPRTPTTSNTATENLSQGHAFFDTNYLYVCVNSTTIKRIALSSF